MPERRLNRLLVAVIGVPLLLVGPAPAAFAGTRYSPLDIDNRLFPLRLGTQFVYDGTVTDEDGTHRHRVVFTVTDLLKRVNGVNTRVILDQDFIDGEPTEAELTFFAQDARGNVRTLGEYPEEYDDGRFAGAPSVWISGQQGARDGILVPGRAVPGRSFSQGTAPAVGFADVAVVRARRARACTPVGSFRNTTRIEETAPLVPGDGKQVKYYQPGLGLVRVDAVGGDSEERLVLTRFRHLGPVGLARVRAKALKLEARAYRISVPYRHTRPMHRAHRRH